MIDDTTAMPKTPAQLPATQPHLQRRLAQLSAHMIESNLLSSISPAAKACLLSNQQYGAAAPLFAIPSCPRFTMDAETTRHYLNNRLLVAVLTNTVTPCDSIHEYPELCAMGDCHTIVHDITCRELANCLQEVGAVVIPQFKPNMLPSDRVHDLQPDLDVTLANVHTFVEVGITSVLAQDNIGNAQCTALSAANRYERAKVNKYRDLASEANAVTTPAIMETSSGAMGRGMQSILDKCDETVSPA